MCVIMIFGEERFRFAEAIEQWSVNRPAVPSRDGGRSALRAGGLDPAEGQAMPLPSGGGLLNNRGLLLSFCGKRK